APASPGPRLEGHRELPGAHVAEGPGRRPLRDDGEHAVEGSLVRVLHHGKRRRVERAELSVTGVCWPRMWSLPAIVLMEEKAVGVDLQKDTKPDETAAGAEANTAPPEAPPPPPYKKTLVIDSSIGAMTFFGEFGKVAPPGPYLRTSLGYEFLKWLMVV